MLHPQEVRHGVGIHEEVPVVNRGVGQTGSLVSDSDSGVVYQNIDLLKLLNPLDHGVNSLVFFRNVQL